MTDDRFRFRRRVELSRAATTIPTSTRPFADLRFATGAMTLAEASPGRLEGRLVGEGWGTWTAWSLNLTGQAFHGNPSQIRLRGTNVIEGETWIYDYRGYLMPHWPGGDEVREVLVGSVIRSNSRKLHDAQEGLYASFYAVRRDG